MTRIYLIRHGQTLFNKRKRIQGSLDIPLSREGHEQAKLLARRFRKVRVDYLFSSEMVRARQTAEAVAKVVRKKVNQDCHLNEMHFGIFEGLTFEQISKNHPDMWEKRERDRLRFTGHKGESLLGFKIRVMRCVHRILQAHPDGHVAIVAHGGTNRAIIGALLGVSMKRLHHIRQDNTCINILDVAVKRKGRYTTRVWTVNDCCHLLGEAFPHEKK